MNASQKIGVHLVATSRGEWFVMLRSWYIRYALTLPPTVLASANRAGIFSQIQRVKPVISTASMNNGTNHRKASPSRARSKPETESFIPAQLSCSQGRKKQIRTNAARLRFICLARFIAALSDYQLSKHCENFASFRDRPTQFRSLRKMGFRAKTQRSAKPRRSLRTAKLRSGASRQEPDSSRGPFRILAGKTPRDKRPGNAPSNNSPPPRKACRASWIA